MLRTCGLVIAVAVLMVACGGGGGGGEAMPAPHDLQYAVGAGAVGSPYGPYPPSVSGTVTGYSVSPALPVGLTLDPTSGVISGTPVAASSGTYTVTASNALGAATAALTLAIYEPPTALAYTSPVTATVGAAFTPLVPSFGGHADSFTVFPPLPPGLTLDPVTGIVSGTPSRERVTLTYTVTAGNGGGAYTHADLVLAVGPPPAGTAVTGVFRGDTVIGLGYVSGTHSGLTDKSGAFTYEEGQGITFSVGAVSIGAVPTAKNLVTPVDLVAQGTGASNRVLNVVRFLMMLDHDGNANNGLQISAAVTAAAASWAPVDFDTADLPTTLGPIIRQASAADGVSHVLPDAATAQAHLRTGFYCTHAGNYSGTFAADSIPGWHSYFVASVFPDGSMHSVANASGTLVGFHVQTNDAVSPLLDGTFAQSAASPSVSLEGSFADATVLKGTYLAAAAGSFQAVADASVAATYKFTGSYTWQAGPYSAPVFFGMDDSNQVSGLAIGALYGGIAFNTLAGTVSGNTFTGTASYSYPGNGRGHTYYSPVSGTYSNTASGATFDGQFSTNDSVVTFSTVGCRAN
jgi:large repetitive protein